MKHIKLISVVTGILMTALILLATSCSTTAGSTNNATPTVVKPEPVVESTTATTSGNQDNYFTTLDVKVKNNGADGMILVQASVTQAGKITQNEDHTFIKNGQTGEFELTFPLVWKGGDFTYSVQTSLP